MHIIVSAAGRGSLVTLSMMLKSRPNRIYFHFSAEYIIPCHKSDPQLDNCIKRSFNHLRGYLAQGLPDIGVPPVEPLLIDRLVMENQAGPVRVTAIFSNITVMGPSNYTVTKIR